VPVHDIYNERIRFHTRDQLAGWVTQNSSSINVLIQGVFQYIADFEWAVNIVSVTDFALFTTHIILKSSVQFQADQQTYVCIQDPFEQTD